MAVSTEELPTPEPSLPGAEIVTPRRQVRLRKPRAIQYWGSATVLVLMVLFCFVGPHVLSLPGPLTTNLLSTNLAPFSHGHLLGTDEVGRDLFSRSLWGGQISMEVGVSAVAIGLVIGTALGTSAAYLGGWVDVVIMRAIDVLLAFPSLVLALSIASYLGPSERDEIIAISVFAIPAYTRYTRAATLRLREQDFLQSATAVGGRWPSTILKHVIPNIFGTVMTFAFLTIASAMLIEAGLSFLGAGIRPPEASWGNIINEGQNYISIAPQLMLVPAAFLSVTVLALNLFGDALRARTL